MESEKTVSKARKKEWVDPKMELMNINGGILVNFNESFDAGTTVNGGFILGTAGS
ncbi:hypothetical protein [Lunatimonas salinarum]|uniref:hypothetical protein n=1 Tax=Lunatimonas salinarum TaxID=1774590 RepID=UPI001ADF51E1|nr:hypothetical protein [Lunatimonas salinarum]